MSFSGLSPLLIVLAVFLVSHSVNGILKELTKPLAEINENIEDAANKLVCDKVGSGLDLLEKVFNSVLKCDLDEQKANEAHCKGITPTNF